MEKNNFNYYDVISKKYDELHSEEQIKKYNFIKEKFNIKDNNVKILDVACGSGIIKEVFKNQNVFGIDNSKKLLEKAKKRNVKTLYYDFNKIPFPFKNKEFDYLFCVTAFHHSKNFLSLAKEFERLSDKIAISLLKKSPSIEEQKEALKKVFKNYNYSFYDLGIDIVFIAKNIN